tara:strand:- start:1796 stop:2404 length:609 start_codon:yes stop_codon:yes gene_type:complete
MRNSFLALMALLSITSVVLTACTGTSGSPKEAVKNIALPAKLDSTALVQRGTYLVEVIGCADCHSPKRMGPQGPEIITELHLSGFPQEGKLPPIDAATVQNGWMMFSPDLTSAVGPWGQSFASNITSDATGIGNWPEENFVRALRKGKYKGLENSRNLLPPMPWASFKNLTDEDIKAIYYFLKTTKPVANIVPEPRQLAEVQ